MTVEAQTARVQRVLVVLNPQSGSHGAEDVREALHRHFSGDGGVCTILETTGDDDLTAVAREASGEGHDLVIAAGGDGTVSAVADGLVGTATPLGILPLGTANVLARELGIPVTIEEACTLLSGPHELRGVDVLQVNGRHYFTQVGIGIDAMMIRDTTREHKRRFGRAAYLVTAVRSLVGFQPRRFNLVVDGQKSRPSAMQIVVANVGTLGQPPFRWGPDIHLDDGRMDVCLVRTRSISDHCRLIWHVLRHTHKQDPNVRYLAARESVFVHCEPALPVQADGEVIGQTPVEIKVVPAAVRVVVPMEPA